jgi:hypothetical protein
VRKGQLGLLPGQKMDSLYEVGQVIRIKVGGRLHTLAHALRALPSGLPGLGAHCHTLLIWPLWNQLPILFQVVSVNASARQMELTLSSKKGAGADDAPDAAAAAAAGDAGGKKKGLKGLPGGFVAGDVIEGAVVTAVEERDGGKGVVALEVKGESRAVSGF